VAYVDQAALASDAAFRSRIRVAMITAAIQIAAEAKGAQDTTVYDKRQQLVRDVLPGGGVNLLDSFAWAVAQNAGITGAWAATD